MYLEVSYHLSPAYRDQQLKMAKRVPPTDSIRIPVDQIADAQMQKLRELGVSPHSPHLRLFHRGPYNMRDARMPFYQDHRPEAAEVWPIVDLMVAEQRYTNRLKKVAVTFGLLYSDEFWIAQTVQIWGDPQRDKYKDVVKRARQQLTSNGHRPDYVVPLLVQEIP